MGIWVRRVKPFDLFNAIVGGGVDAGLAARLTFILLVGEKKLGLWHELRERVVCDFLFLL